jgi:excisionase family DNA binding protein
MIIVEGITVEDLLAKIDALVEKRLAEHLNVEKPSRLMNRKEVAAFLRVSTLTVSTWSKEGLLPYHRMGSRIYYKSNEVEAALHSVKKYHRRWSS